MPIENENFNDEYHGVGGCYVIDPATGKRVPVLSVPEQVSTIPAVSDPTQAEVIPEETKLTDVAAVVVAEQAAPAPIKINGGK